MQRCEHRQRFLAHMQTALPELPAEAFAKQDRNDDRLFYAPARLVTHIDDPAIDALTAYYAQTLPQGGVVLDLMSSWVSHLPVGLTAREVIGHGMNARELAANPRLDRWFAQDLNASPLLPLEDASIDAALCCVSIQYLEQPVAVLQDIRRVLRADAPFIVSFSNRCFPTKAVAIWRALDMAGQAALVRLYFERAGFGSITADVLRDGHAGDPLIVVSGRA